MRRPLHIAGLLTLCLASAALAQVKLELKHHEGTLRSVTTAKVRQVLTIAGMDVPTEADVRTTMAYTAGAPAADGTLRLQVKTEATTALIKFPGGMLDYDSAKPDVKNDNPMLDALLDEFRGMKGAVYTLVYDKDGKVTAVEGTDKILAAAPAAAQASLKLQLDPETLKRTANQERGVLPDGPVKKGDQWRRMEISPIGGGQTLSLERFYTYEGTVEKGGKTLDKIGIFTGKVGYALEPNPALPLTVVNSDLKAGVAQGTILFDRERGEIVESSETLQLLGPMTFSLNGMELPGKVDLTMESSTVYKR